MLKLKKEGLKFYLKHYQEWFKKDYMYQFPEKCEKWQFLIQNRVMNDAKLSIKDPFLF